MVSAQQPLVSVCVLSYNHEKFIAETLDSVMQQKTNFGFEVLIFDDGSADGTAAILKKYEKDFPLQVKLFLSPENKGSYANGLRIAGHATGKYIAFLDGDDKWLYDEKLQKQVAFLEQNAGYAGAFHDAAIEIVRQPGETAKTTDYWLFEGFKYYSQCYKYGADYFPWDGLQRKIIPHSSLIVHRDKYLTAVQNYPKQNLSGSWILQQIIIQGSMFRYFNEVWSVYREHRGGVTKKNDPIKFNISNIEALKLFLSLKAYAGMKKLVYEAIAQEYKFILYSDKFKALPLTKRLNYTLGFICYEMAYVVREVYHVLFL